MLEINIIYFYFILKFDKGINEELQQSQVLFFILLYGSLAKSTKLNIINANIIAKNKKFLLPFIIYLIKYIIGFFEKFTFY